MYLTLPASDVRIFIDDSSVHAFETAYYPLDDNTLDVFLSSFSKEHRIRMDALLASVPIPQEAVDEITEIVQSELSHALDLVDECSK